MTNYGRDRKLAELRHLRPLADLRLSELVRLGRYDRVECPPGRTAAVRGTPARWVYLVVAGEVEVGVANGRTRVCRPGDFIGDEAALAGRPYPHTATARTASRLLAIPAGQFKALTAEVPALQSSVMHALSERLITAEAGHARVRRRVAYAR